MPDPLPGPVSSKGPRADLALVACCTAQFLLTVNGSIVSIILPDIATEFGATLTQLQWTVAIYVLAVACLLTVMGNLADRLGRRVILLAGLVSLILGSIVCAVSPDVVVLTGGRALQAVGGAMLASSGLAAVSAQSHDVATRARAIAWWAAIGSVALAAGPFVGGLVAQAVGWRGVFWLSVPLAIIAIILVLVAVQESRAATLRPADPIGQVLVSGLILTGAFSLIEGVNLGWGSPIILGGFAVSATLLVVAVLRARRMTDPLIPLTLFRNRSFLRGSLTSIVGFAAAAGLLFVAPQYLRGIRDQTALEAGMFLLPLAVAALIAAQLSGRIVARGRTRVDLLLAGALVAAASLILLIGADASIWWVAVGFVVFGFGYGLLNDPLSVTALASLPDAEAGLASALFSTAKQTGQLLGIAAIGTALAAASSDFATAYSAASGWVWGILLACGIGVVLLNVVPPRASTPPAATAT